MAGPLIASLAPCLQAADPIPAEEPRPDESVAARVARHAKSSLVVIVQHGREGQQSGVGAGFVVSSNGLVATCLHVIGEARPIEVRMADGRRLTVKEVHAWDRHMDLAVLRMDETECTPLPLGDSTSLAQGALIVALGNPLGLEHSVVQGVLSARREWDGFEMLQLAIPVEPGNSGGPVLDQHGKVHGILNMKSALTRNLGFAIPVERLKALLEKPNPVPMERWLTIGALNAKDWRSVFGASWSRRGGRILVEDPGDSFGGRALCLYQRPLPEQPYEVSVSVRLDDEAGAAGLVFGSDGEHKHYGFYPSAGQMRLTRFDGANVFSWTILKQVASPHYRPEDWNALKVRLITNHVQGFVNGRLVVDMALDSMPQGQVGLAKFRETHAEFQKFQVTAWSEQIATPEGLEPPGVLSGPVATLAGHHDAALLADLQNHADSGQAALQQQALLLEQQATRLQRLARQVHRDRVCSALARELNQPEHHIDLFRSALWIAQLDDPDLDATAYQAQLEQMAAELRAKLEDTASDQERLDQLREYLYEENGFHGSRDDYYNRANSYVSQVLDDREGIPITLSIIFMELAWRIGLTNVVGIPLPGHFVVRYTSKAGQEQLMDPFDRGRDLSLEQARQRAMDLAGVVLRPEHMEPARKREVIVRMLRNLHGVAERGDRVDEALGTMDAILALQPDSGPDRVQRVGLRLRAGNLAGAREDLRWLLDHPPAGLDVERVLELYQWLLSDP